MEEKYKLVQETSRKASKLFKMADAQGSYPGTPSSAGTPVSPSSVAATVLSTVEKVEILKDDPVEKTINAATEKIHERGTGENASTSENKDSIAPPERSASVLQNDKNSTSVLEVENKQIDEESSADVKSSRPDPIDVKSTPHTGLDDVQVARTDTFSESCQVDDLVEAHEELLSSIKDLEEAMSVYDELVSIAELLTAQKCTNTLDFCIQKHKRISKTMTVSGAVRKCHIKPT